MKRNGFRFASLCAICMPLGVFAQWGDSDLGIRAGNFILQPEVQTLAAYEDTDGADPDLYGEAQAGIRVENAEARYDLLGDAYCGYRAYDENSYANDNFYGFGGDIASSESLLKLRLRAYHKKTVDYDVLVDDGTGSNLGSIITADTSIRTSAGFDARYEKQLTDKSLLIPGYEGRYYKQEFESSLDDAEWHEHTATLGYGYRLVSRTLLTLSAGYTMQLADEEDGSVAEMTLGAENTFSDKLWWRLRGGIAVADYENSGNDNQALGDLTVRWRATDKISAYIFGRSGYQPGYSGGSARRIYRAGYGAEWAVLHNLSFSGQILHDRQESIRTDVVDELHFANVEVQYTLVRRIVLALGGSYYNEKTDPDRMVAYSSATIQF